MVLDLQKRTTQYGPCGGITPMQKVALAAYPRPARVSWVNVEINVIQVQRTRCQLTACRLRIPETEVQHIGQFYSSKVNERYTIDSPVTGQGRHITRKHYRCGRKPSRVFHFNSEIGKINRHSLPTASRQLGMCNHNLPYVWPTAVNFDLQCGTGRNAVNLDIEYQLALAIAAQVKPGIQNAVITEVLGSQKCVGGAAGD